MKLQFEPPGSCDRGSGLLTVGLSLRLRRDHCVARGRGWWCPGRAPVLALGTRCRLHPPWGCSGVIATTPTRAKTHGTAAGLPGTAGYLLTVWTVPQRLHICWGEARENKLPPQSYSESARRAPGRHPRWLSSTFLRPQCDHRPAALCGGMSQQVSFSFYASISVHPPMGVSSPEKKQHTLYIYIYIYI